MVHAYTQGALSYIGFNNLVAGLSATAGLISVGTPDAVVNVFTNELEKAKGFSIAAGFTHYWTPTVQTNLFGSYARIDYAAHRFGDRPGAGQRDRLPGRR